MKQYFKRNLIYGILFISLPLLLLAITVGGGLCFDELRQLPNSGWLLFRDDAEKNLQFPVLLLGENWSPIPNMNLSSCSYRIMLTMMSIESAAKKVIQ